MYEFFRPGKQIFIDALVNDASPSSFINFESFHRKLCNSRVFTKLNVFKQQFVPFLFSYLFGALRKGNYVGFTE